MSDGGIFAVMLKEMADFKPGKWMKWWNFFCNDPTGIQQMTFRLLSRSLSFDVRSSYMIYFIYIIHIHLFHGNIWTHNWPTPNVSGFIVQLPVENRTGIARSHGWSPKHFFRLLYTSALIATTTARIILHFISFPQSIYDLFRLHHSHEWNLQCPPAFEWILILKIPLEIVPNILVTCDVQRLK